MDKCTVCNAPLVSLTSQNIKVCVDYPFSHVFDNKLKEGQTVLIKYQR